MAKIDLTNGEIDRKNVLYVADCYCNRTVASSLEVVRPYRIVITTTPTFAHEPFLPSLIPL